MKNVVYEPASKVEQSLSHGCVCQTRMAPVLTRDCEWNQQCSEIPPTLIIRIGKGDRFCHLHRGKAGCVVLFPCRVDFESNGPIALESPPE